MNIKNYLKGFDIKLLVVSLLLIPIATAYGYGRNQEKEQNAQTGKKNEQNIVRKEIDYKAGKTPLKGIFFMTRIKRRKVLESLLCTNGGAIMLTAKIGLRCWQN